jgi:hypothetical protein
MLGQVRADRDEDGVKAAFLPLSGQVLDPVVAGNPDSEGGDPVQLGGHDVAGEPVGRDAVAHHPARLAAGIADLHLMAKPGQVVGGGQAARARADDQHPAAGPPRRGIEVPATLQREVAEEALHRVDGHGAVQVGAVADAFARVIADPAVDGG